MRMSSPRSCAALRSTLVALASGYTLLVLRLPVQALLSQDTGCVIALRCRSAIAWFALLGPQLVACHAPKVDKQADPPQALHTPVAPAAPVEVKPEQGATHASTIVESDVRALVAEWLVAQKARDFAGYEQLYADPFQGIKRVGARTYRFDRRRWMADRQRMFAAPMHIEISELTISIASRLAIARFEQRWSSKTFRDHGPKQLIVVPQAAGLRISNEIMLTSEVDHPVLDDLARADFMHVVHARHDYAVLSTNASEDWARGPAVLDSGSRGRVESARKAARIELIPQTARSLLGSTVIAYGATGPSCRATLGKPFVWRRVVPHFGKFEDEASEAPLSDRAKGEAIWGEAGERTLLVVELTDRKGDCATALWARAADRSEPTLFIPEATPPALTRRIEQQVRALPEYRDAERDYRAFVNKDFAGANGEADGVTPHWENFDGSKPTISSWRQGERLLASYEVSAGGCGDFGASLWALFERRGDRLVLVSHSAGSSVPSDFAFVSIVDVDLDGLPDALGGDWDNADGEADTFTRGTPRGLRFVQEIDPPFHDCGC
jgi:hypothetical protein